jgi:hypothetical protein
LLKLIITRTSAQDFLLKIFHQLTAIGTPFCFLNNLCKHESSCEGYSLLLPAMSHLKSSLFLLLLAITTVGCKKETEAPKTENPKALKAADMVGTYKYNYQFTGSSVSSDLITQIIEGDNESQFHVVNFTSRDILLKVNMTGSAGTILNFTQDAFGSELSGTGSISNNGNTVELSFTETNNASTYTGVQTMIRQ